MFQDQTLQTLIRGIRYEIQCLQFLRQCNCGRLKGILGDRGLFRVSKQGLIQEMDQRTSVRQLFVRQSKFHELTLINEDKTQIIE